MTHKITIFTFIFIFVISACVPLSGTLEVGLATQTPEIGTEPASAPAPATHTPETVSTLGTVTGSVCYPSEAIPAMTAYFEDQVSSQVSQLAIAENQDNYSIELDPGEYLAFAYRESQSIKTGGMYSQAVACGLSVDCSDHTPLVFTVQAGETTSGVDICDWYAQDLLPPPPGQSALAGPYQEIAGLVYTDIPANETWMIDRNGFPQRLYSERDAKPSPDGGRVLLDREDGIWLVDLASGEEKNLTAAVNRSNGNSQWWPANPEVIVLNSTAPDAGPTMSFGQVSLMQQDGSGYQVLEENRSIWGPAPSPDGRTIAYDTVISTPEEAVHTAWLYHLDTGKEQLDPADYGLDVPEDFLISSPSWSPDGNRITWRVGGSFAPEGVWKIALLLFDLSTKTHSFVYEYQPAGGFGGWTPPAVWSPDGEWLAFTDHSRGRVPELVIMRPDGSDVRSLGDGTLQLWSPDSSKLIFIDYGQGSYLESQIILVDIESMQTTVLDLPPGSQQIQWGLR
jgi:Tol biopolymer transport system component